MAETTLRDWIADHPPSDDAFRQSLAGVAQRVRAGEPFLPAVRELLDEFSLLPRDALRARAIAERPAETGDARYDAFLGALAEHLALGAQLDRPAWCSEPSRFLDRFWFLSDVRGFRATAIVQSPAAFRRRGVFVALGALERR